MDGTVGSVLHETVRLPLLPVPQFGSVVDDICALPWASLGAHDLLQAAQAYYYFSVQFRENLEIACRLYPHDTKLQRLRHGECNTDNLSPWPGIAGDGERLDHDEFMRRALALDGVWDPHGEALGRAYLARVRQTDELARAKSIASYEDGGLTRVFTAMLRACNWQTAGGRAFKFFLQQHILFDSDDGEGHGSLSRHLRPDDSILPLWIGFRELLIAAVPRFWECCWSANREPLLAVAAA